MTGNKSDPGNYRDICASACLGKLFSSIINERLLKFVVSNDLLHPSQIVFFINKTEHLIPSSP